MKRWAFRWGGRVVMAVILGLGGINGAIWGLGGGTPFLLSPYHLEDKLDALSQLVRHVPLHFSGGCQHSSEGLLRKAAHRHRIPFELVWGVAKAESNLLPHRISHAGAMGFMQLMPDTARWLKVDDPFDQKESIDGGARFLAWLWKRYDGDRRRVVAAYNLGPGRVPRRGIIKMPMETKIYVSRVMAASTARARKR